MFTDWRFFTNTKGDVIVEPVSINDYIVHFNIYSNGEKQLHSLINIIREDINVIDFELLVIEEC